MRKAEVKYIPESISKIMGIVVTTLMMILLVMKDLSRGVSNFSRKKPSYEAGLQVGGYEAASGMRVYE